MLQSNTLKMGRSCMIFATVLINFSFDFYSSATVTGAPINNSSETDRLALLVIKSNLDDGPSQVLGSWNDSSLNFCNWKGVTCSPKHQRVMMLDLTSQGLVGSLSPYIGNLTFLRRFSLENNSFHGEIPSEIGRLYRLQVLWLSNNSFVGKIPANISGCTDLRYLELGFNKLEGDIPLELASMSKLLKLVLDSNGLTGKISPFIGNLSSLRSLALSANSIGGTIPNSLGKLKNLTWLGLGLNTLSGMVPPLIYNISSLQTLFLFGNLLSGSLPPLIRLPSLVTFSIAKNRFSGTIPSSLFNASGLENIDLATNNFSGKVPVEVGNPKGLLILQLSENRLGSGRANDLEFLNNLQNHTHLTSLEFQTNHFGGVLPNAIANLSDQLSYLYIGYNQIHGVIPPGIGKYLNLLSLGMNDILLSGSIPSNIGLLQNLQALYLEGNTLSGKLPSSLGNISSLYMLDLSENMLEGNIIPSITKYQVLQELYLNDNKFNGTIPKEIVGLSSQLRYLDLANNFLIGSLPSQFGEFLHIQMLNISDNKLSGQIPRALGGCLSLEGLSLKGNFLQGSIPTSFKFLKEMTDLDLSMNNLSGEIPKDLELLPSLRNLNLSFNNLEGGVPTKGVFRKEGNFSVVGNYKLCGGIPELHFAKCHTERSKKVKISSALAVTLGVLISLILVAFSIILVCYLRKRPKAEPFSTETILGADFERVSYQGLHRATNGFSLGNLIGVGSLGSVYKAILHEDEGPVAVKVLQLIERGASKRFTTECDALRKIRHRNLLKIITICSSVDFKGNEFKALILEFMPNGSLELLLHPNSGGQHPTRVLSLFERLTIAIDVASALDYLHNGCEIPLVHCDLKPSNILLDGDMTAHLGDFGLAKFLPQSTNNISKSESSVSTKGTIGYIPPEYGTGTEVSKQGDVYSYGIILLQMITGKRPTDNMFKDGLTLHYFSSMALPLDVMDIVDSQMPVEKGHDKAAYMNDRVQECIVSLVKVGVACCLESQWERMNINDVLMELHVIKEKFLGGRMN